MTFNLRVLGLTLAVGAVACSRQSPQADVPTSPATVPPPPAWSLALIGRQISSLPATAPCEGVVDLVDMLYTGGSGGSQIEGWAWDAKGASPVPRILVGDKSGRIVGAGEGGGARPDVPNARPAVTSPKVGWKAVSTIRQGDAAVYGLTSAGALCKIADHSIQPAALG